MAAGSHAGWDGIAAELRVCASCGRKVTLKEPGGLHIRFFPSLLIKHGDCERASKEKL